MFIILGKVIRFVKHHWLTVGFILGFFTDLILLNRIDDTFDNSILFFYAVLSTISILLFYVGVAEKAPEFLSRLFKKYAPILMQYSFGGLFSGMLIFYGRSGDWLASAPFMLLIISVILGNELLDKRSNRLIYQLASYFIGIFSYVILEIPVLTGEMGGSIFILSGVISLLIVTFVVQMLYRIIPHFMALNTSKVIFSIGAIYVLFNALYFANIIPPIPLSLTSLEIVQAVDPVSGGGYRVQVESQPWYRRMPLVIPILHPTKNSIACFARVFAPTKLSTEIFQHWEYKDEEGNWQEHFRLGYEISGSSDDGYGGYTRIESFSDGVWRCSVETKRGQVLGRQSVLIDTSGKVGEIVTQVE